MVDIGKIKDLLGLGEDKPDEIELAMEKQILPDIQQEKLERDIEQLDDDDGQREKRVLREVQKRIQDVAEDSMKKLQFARLGRCPSCGEHLNQHAFATICEACGWHTYDVPRRGPVRVHIHARETPIEGDRCYALKTGDVLVVKQDVVIARIMSNAIRWVEYLWADHEIEQRYKQILERTEQPCSWCEKTCHPEQDGFHLVHVAFGTTQERHCFCSDECYEAFRRMYPARVHRNCYERKCADCNFCIKRYADESDGFRLPDKDGEKTAEDRKPDEPQPKKA